MRFANKKRNTAPTDATARNMPNDMGAVKGIAALATAGGCNRSAHIARNNAVATASPMAHQTIPNASTPKQPTAAESMWQPNTARGRVAALPGADTISAILEAQEVR